MEDKNRLPSAETAQPEVLKPEVDSRKGDAIKLGLINLAETAIKVGGDIVLQMLKEKNANKK
jgi:hypothetical protein